MGLSHGTLLRYCNYVESGLLPKKMVMLELGRQQLNDMVFLYPECVEKLCALLGKKSFLDVCDYRPRSASDEANANPHHDECPFAEALFRHLGAEYEAVDMVPGCTRMDLNTDSVPDDKRGRFNLVTNYGTTEHLINQANAFKAVHDFTAPGGLMIHDLPYLGYPQHGFFSYTSLFFQRLAEFNHYEIATLDLTFGNSYKMSDMKNEREVFRTHGAIYNLNDENMVFYDGGIFAALRKTVDAPFVTPLDIPLNELSIDIREQLKPKGSWLSRLLMKIARRV